MTAETGTEDQIVTRLLIAASGEKDTATPAFKKALPVVREAWEGAQAQLAKLRAANGGELPYSDAWNTALASKAAALYVFSEVRRARYAPLKHATPEELRDAPLRLEQRDPTVVTEGLPGTRQHEIWIGPRRVLVDEIREATARARLALIHGGCDWRQVRTVLLDDDLWEAVKPTEDTITDLEMAGTDNSDDEE